MSVTVIMRSKNADWVIDQALAGLFSQRFRDFELIVVDSGSKDRTLEIVRRYPCTLVQIEARRYYPGAVLNDAIARCRSEVVVFQNSDVVPLTPETLGALVTPFADAAVDATFARQIPRPEAHAWVRRDYAVGFPEAGEPPAWMPYSLPLAAMRRSAWEAHPFYEDAWGSEDTEWGTWARRDGRRVAYVPDALVMHSHNYTVRELYGRRFIEGEADAFIRGGRDTAARALRRYAASVGRDAIHHLRSGDPGGLLLSPIRRAAYQLGYLDGFRHGARRRSSGDRDASHGQRVVLERFGGAAASERR